MKKSESKGLGSGSGSGFGFRAGAGVGIGTGEIFTDEGVVLTRECGGSCLGVSVGDGAEKEVLSWASAVDMYRALGDWLSSQDMYGSRR